ncbi:MAG: glycosyltransferase family 9 protein [Crocinitomicaceae bacterium]|nr:glycosyltransferase family 9 protein [Crocinitomicaceae bacterium]
MSDWNGKRIMISRMDSIGDVMLTLPMCEWLKNNYPNATLIFLGKSYTIPILKAFKSIDEIVDWDEFQDLPTVNKLSKLHDLKIDAIVHVFPNKEIASFAKKVKIPYRIGTSHRSFHLLTCNYRLNFTRKRSDLHESQLNFELLRPFGLTTIPSMEEVVELTHNFKPIHEDLPKDIQEFIKNNSKFVILHPKSQGSAVEWPIENYAKLASLLIAKGYGVAYTGTDKEGVKFRENISLSSTIIDTTGKLTLNQLMLFIQQASGLVACSTGPLHISGFLGTRTVGLFSNRKPIHPGRWHAIGNDTHYVVADENCEQCKKGKPCKCIETIDPERVMSFFV